MYKFHKRFLLRGTQKRRVQETAVTGSLWLFWCLRFVQLILVRKECCYCLSREETSSFVLMIVYRPAWRTRTNWPRSSSFQALHRNCSSFAKANWSRPCCWRSTEENLTCILTPLSLHASWTSSYRQTNCSVWRFWSMSGWNFPPIVWCDRPLGMRILVGPGGGRRIDGYTSDLSTKFGR